MKLNDSLIEAGKEFLRVVLLSVIPVLMSALEENKFDWRVIAVVAAIAALRFVDKWLHENAPKGTAGGLTRF